MSNDSSKAQATAKPKRLPHPPPQVNNRCIEIVENKLNETTHFIMEVEQGVQLEVELKFIVCRDDGFSFNAEAYQEAGLPVPDEELLSTVRPVQPWSTYLENGFPRGNSAKHNRIVPSIVRLLEPIIGEGTIYGKSDVKIRNYLTISIMPSIRGIYLNGARAGEERDTRTGIEKLVIRNLERPNRGLHSIIQFDDVLISNINDLLTIGRVDPTRRMSVAEAQVYTEQLLAQVDVFNKVDAELIMSMPPEDYALYCMQRVKKDSIDATNELAIQDAQGVRAASGINVSLVSHGNVMTLEDGVQCAYSFKEGGEYGDERRFGTLAVLHKGTHIHPSCIGALKKKYLKGKWTKEDYYEFGPNYLVELLSTYLYDIWNCRLYRVFEPEELKQISSRCPTENYFWRSLIPLGVTGFSLALCVQPGVQTSSGLECYQYNLRASGYSNLQMNINAHQLTEWVKRELGLDSRGLIWYEIARRLGHENKTPEEVFPLVGLNSIAGEEYADRLDFINQHDQNEVGDVEHPYHRSRLEHNNAVSTRATNHSYNVRIGTTQHHDNNGTGDHNFAHVHIEYSSNSVGNGNAMSTEQRKEHRKRKRTSN